MFSFLLADQNAPFTVSLLLFLIIVGFEILGAVMGMGVFGALGDLLSGADADVDVDVDIDGDVDGSITSATGAEAVHLGMITKIFGWLKIGKAPVLVSLIIFLVSFSFAGYSIQLGSQRIWGGLLTPLIASIPAFIGALLVMRAFTEFIGRMVPKDESEAISKRSFVGRIATVGAATAKQGLPAEAKFRDEYGQVHYVLVEPDNEGEQFEPESVVIIVRVEGSVCRAIRNPSSALRT